LHPSGTASDEEFDEYVAYAVECRRRVKEQMNKRKPDDEFAKINLSYFKVDGSEVVVYCPESKDASATQFPARVSINSSDAKGPDVAESHGANQTALTEAAPNPAPLANAVPELSTLVQDLQPVLSEQHFTILYGDTGHTYESIMGPYLKGAKSVDVEDPYIRMPHQIQNFVRFCEAVMKAGTVRKISLLTSFDDATPLADMNDKLDQLRQSLLEQDVELVINVNPNLHDREIRIDNGWVIKIGRGLDFYQRPASWFEIGSMDMSLRKCLETKVDIFRS
jgi:ATP-dependent Lon protease